LKRALENDGNKKETANPIRRQLIRERERKEREKKHNNPSIHYIKKFLIIHNIPKNKNELVSDFFYLFDIKQQFLLQAP
jgi:hypothetical protein